MFTTHDNAERGSIFLITLFFASLFLMMFGATLSYIMVQHRAVQQEVWKAQSIAMAEAGAQYFRWHLAHNPTDYASDTGEHAYPDPQGGVFGNYTIDVTPPPTGSTVATITVEGAPVGNPNARKRVRVLYGKPSLAQYAFLTNSNVWFGESEELSGRLHSNGGIRMDGIADSLVTSAQDTYICGAEHGCADEEKPGVWGTGEIPELWEYPKEAIDFNSLLLDLAQMQSNAQDGGVYLGDSGGFGYFVEFFADGTLTINRVTSVRAPVYGYDGNDWTYEQNDKANWTPVSGYQHIPIPSNGLIFLEDDVWVGGDVNGRATLVAARLPDGSAPYADIYIQEDITYVAKDGTNTLGLIGQADVLVPLEVNEDILEIDAALVAVNGHAYRYYYPQWTYDPYKTYAIRDRIETYGTLITNTTWTWSWVSDTSTVVSGFEETETTYDPDLLFAPPPSFPTQDEFSFISWEELELNEE